MRAFAPEFPGSYDGGGGQDPQSWSLPDSPGQCSADEYSDAGHAGGDLCRLFGYPWARLCLSPPFLTHVRPAASILTISDLQAYPAVAIGVMIGTVAANQRAFFEGTTSCSREKPPHSLLRYAEVRSQRRVSRLSAAVRRFTPRTQAHEDSRELHPSASRHDRGLSEHTRGHYFDWAQSRKIWSWDSLK